MAIQNIWDPTVNPAMGQWTNWDPTMTGIDNFNTDGASTSMAPTFNTDPAWLASLGFTGPIQANYGNNTDSQSQSSVTSPELRAWLRNNGYNLQLNSSDASHGSKQLGRLVDAQGNQIGQGIQWGEGNDDAFGIAALLAGGFAGAAAAGVGAGAAGAGTTAGGGGSTAGLSADQLAYGSLENGASYGGGYGGSLTASSEPGFGGALGDAGAQGSTSGLSSFDANSLYGAQGYGAGATPGELGAGESAGGLGGYAAPTNAAGIDSAAGTPGYGASSAGAGGGVGDLSGIAGPTTGSSLSTQLANLFTPSNAATASKLAGGSGGGSGSSAFGGLVGLAGALGAFGKGDTSLLNSVNYNQAATAMGQSARTNQTNAQGSLTYNQNGQDALGNPTYSQDVRLNAPYQQNLNQALGNQSTALGNLSSYNQGLPSAYANAPSVYGNAGSQQALAQQQQDAMYDQQKRYLDPQYDLQSKQLQAQLANQGVTYGSDAYNNAMTQFGSQQNQAYGTARDSAINSGNQYANTLFNQNLQANQLYNNNLNNQGANYANQASGALNGVVQNPTFAATPPPTNYLGAAQGQANQNVNLYNAQTGNSNNITNGLTGIGQGLFSNPGVWSSIGSGLSGLFGGGG